ncbi:septum formation initiator family protein [Desulfitobacterium sp.]|uniref:FtsB family cell division protein n=1 Tax=Desulfitobacterium sp. TaxID=49981 RepID=UPI002B21F32F|nr:septum formation initiator family protein [Desulfitobacterium sp.]MEA4902845.1 septum formation initiator family protein [Desulfitobacterium sp.]
MKKIQKVNKSRPVPAKKRKPKFRLGTFILVAFVATVFTTSGWQLYQLQHQVNGKIAQLEVEKEGLLAEKSDLESEIVKLNTPSYVEQLAREQLGLVRKGEIMISPKKQ